MNAAQTVPAMDNKPHNLIQLDRDKGYRFSEPGSLLYQARIAINRSDLSSKDVAGLVVKHTGRYMDHRTIDKLMNGQTTLPRLQTVEHIMHALGYHISWSRNI
jgi:hypothetical protein